MNKIRGDRKAAAARQELGGGGGGRQRQAPKLDGNLQTTLEPRTKSYVSVQLGCRNLPNYRDLEEHIILGVIS